MNVKLIKGYEPKLYIYNEAMNKMDEYIRQSNLEIGWLGVATKEEGIYYIKDVFLFEQEVHETTTEITTEGLNKFAMEVIQEENGMEKWNNMRVWGHSHVNMSTQPSGQDENQMNLFLENSNEFFIRIIANKKGDYNITLYDYETGVCYERVDYDVFYEGDTTKIINTITNQIKILREKLNSLINPNEQMKKDIESEIKAKVRRKVYKAKIKTTNKMQKYKKETYDWYDYMNSDFPTTKAQKIFDNLNVEEIYLLMEAIENGSTSSEIITSENIDYLTSKDLDQLVEDFCYSQYEDYEKWINGGLQ